jgi:hypothetical protein
MNWRLIPTTENGPNLRELDRDCLEKLGILPQFAEFRQRALETCR